MKIFKSHYIITRVVGSLIQQDNIIKTRKCCLGNNRNNLHLKHVSQGWNTQSEIDLGKYYRVWCEIIPSQNDYIKLYRCTTKIILKTTAHRINVPKEDMNVAQI